MLVQRSKQAALAQAHFADLRGRGAGVEFHLAHEPDGLVPVLRGFGQREGAAGLDLELHFQGGSKVVRLDPHEVLSTPLLRQLGRDGSGLAAFLHVGIAHFLNRLLEFFDLRIAHEVPTDAATRWIVLSVRPRKRVTDEAMCGSKILISRSTTMTPE